MIVLYRREDYGDEHKAGDVVACIPEDTQLSPLELSKFGVALVSLQEYETIQIQMTAHAMRPGYTIKPSDVRHMIYDTKKEKLAVRTS